MPRSLLVALLLLLPAAAGHAQRDQGLPAGVSLATRYTKLGRPIVALRPFAAEPAAAGAAASVADIITSDLTRSDRYEMFSPPSALAQDGPVDYAQWNSLNVVYLVTGEVTRVGEGVQLSVTVHDVVYGNEKQGRSFPLPQPGSPEYRMAVHVVSDEIVRWISNQPGMAATRVAFVRQNGGGSYDLLIADSDGEDMRRIAGSPRRIYSPAWSFDGRKLAYALEREEGGWNLVERDVATGATRALAEGSLIQSPAYAPDGSLWFASWVDSGRGAGLELHVWSGGSVRRVTSTVGDNLSPAVSPDGRRVAFHSSRTGRHHIYAMPADGGGNPVLISPIGDRAEFYAPDWSPTGTQVVFHGQSRDAFHLMLGDAARPGGQITQLTSSGRNEDPSFAPDGRHIVFTGMGSAGPGLYVIDTITGETRPLVRGDGLRLADWSPSIARPVTLGNRP